MESKKAEALEKIKSLKESKANLSRKKDEESKEPKISDQNFIPEN